MRAARGRGPACPGRRVACDGHRAADGRAAWAFACDGGPRASGALPEGTSPHVAEWHAVAQALAHLAAHVPGEAALQVDAALVAKGLAARRPAMAGEAAQLRAACRQALARLAEGGLAVRVERVPRERNRQADMLARQAALGNAPQGAAQSPRPPGPSPAVEQVRVEDRAGTGRARQLEAALHEAAAAYREAGHALRRPLRCDVQPLGPPAFLETQPGAGLHVLHLRPDAAGEAWLPGLLARELAHAVLGDEGHASHDPALLQAAFAAARQRSRALPFLGLVAAVNHHVRDVYADDLAARVAPGPLQGFLEHLALRAAALAPGWERAVALGYAAGTLARRGQPAPPALAAALAGEPGARRLADGFAGLHPEPEPADLERALLRLLAQLPAEA